MLITAAMCPGTPLLVGQVAGVRSADLAELRAACDAAVDGLARAAPELVVVVGEGPRARGYPGTSAGSLRGYGPDVRVGTGDPVLPPALTIGRWLVQRAGLPAAALWFEAVPTAWSPAACSRLGAGIAARAGRTAMLVVGDGSARRGEGAPQHRGADAAKFDASVARALAAGDAAALAALDAALAAELGAAGRAPWQVLAGAAGGNDYAAELLADVSPFTVGYLVAVWTAKRTPAVPGGSTAGDR